MLFHSPPLSLSPSSPSHCSCCVADSIVIGFWVGLAVFVIFMFFVLTLLTKTGAPHPEGAEPCKKRVRLTSCVEDLRPPADPDNRPCLQLDSSLSRSLFHCYINEEQAQGGSKPRAGAGAVGVPRGGLVQGPGRGRSGSPEERVVVGMEVGVSHALEAMSLSHFNIPNVVNSEHSSALGADDLLLGEPPIIMEGECHRPNSAHHMMD
uniref:Melanocortin 2 receptor accessory protein 2a n=1 Tax=Hucho hucho TaxID=62062 RepID=A0A4W5NRC3_9TELE